MNNIEIGKVIKSLRKFAGLSQKELSKDICSQPQLSKIENNNEIQSALILLKLSKRLEVDINYFFEKFETPRLDYIQEFKDLIIKLKRERNYLKIREYLEKEKRNLLFSSSENQQFLFWHEAICSHYLDGNTSEGISELYHALNLTYSNNSGFYSESEVEILNSIAILQKEKNYIVKLS